MDIPVRNSRQSRGREPGLTINSAQTMVFVLVVCLATQDEAIEVKHYG